MVNRLNLVKRQDTLQLDRLEQRPIYLVNVDETTTEVNSENVPRVVKQRLYLFNILLLFS